MKKKFKLVVASGKGGVGKSMVASTMTMLFSQKMKIVAVDADVDAPNLHLWLGQNQNWDQKEKISTNELAVIDPEKCNRCGKCVDICAFNALKIKNNQLEVNKYFCEGCAACQAVCPQKAITMKRVKNGEIRIINNVWGFPLVSAQLYPGQTGSGKIVEEIKKRAEELDWQLLILDSPAGTGCPVIASLKDADYSLLVTEPTPSGFSDLKRVLQVVNHFQLDWGLIINKWDLNQKETKKIASWAKNQPAGQLLGKISYDQQVFKAIAQLQPILKSQLKAKKELKEIYQQLNKQLKTSVN